MSGRDTTNTEMLSAYLDGELSSEERHEVERKLAESSELRQLLGQLRQLSDDLRLLPRYRLGEPVYDRILSEIEQLSKASADDAQEPLLPDELISAYLDGELPDADRQRVEHQLETSAEHCQLLDELRGLHDTLRSLPKHQLDDGFADRVVRRAERETLLGSSTDAAEVTTAPRPVSVAKRSRWRVYVWAAVTVAAIVALVFSLPRGGNDSDLDLVGPGANTDTQGIGPDGVPRVPPKEGSPALVDVDPDAETDGNRVSPHGRVDLKKYSQWQLVTLIQRTSGQQLFFVYELTITPEGVEKAAFANFLRRHQIRFRQATSVGPKEQKSLLKYRFFRGVQIATDKSDDMDEIQLYMVSCAARKVDAMFADLMSRPEGIGSFSMDLTNADAGDRVLHHLCEASGVSDEIGQAVELLGNFAILSRSSRNLGIFGRIGIDPSLLDGSLARPPETMRDEMPNEFDRNSVGVGPPPEAAKAGDFGCELLFVVRNLKPLDGEAEGETDDETQHGD